MKRLAILTLGVFALATPVEAQVLDFENINATYPSGYAYVQGFYNGGTSSVGTSGVNHGIEFSSNAQAICLNTPGVTCSNTSRGGVGDPDSQKGGLFFLSGGATFMNRTAGFQNGFSFFYSAINSGGSFSVWSGLNGTGLLLASLVLPTTQSGPCPGYNAGFCPFVAAGVAFAGLATSVTFAGVANQIVFDDVTFGSSTPGSVVPEPATVFLLGTGLMGLGFVAWRRREDTDEV